MKDRERKTHDNRQHSILMDAKLVLLSQNVRVAISQSMLDYIYTCCATKREARHKINSWRVSQVEKKIDFKFVLFVFFVLPEIGMIEMQSMIILLFSFSLTTVKKKDRSRRETTDLKKRDKTESKHKTPHFEKPPRDSLNQSRSRGWCWFRRGRFFLREETQSSTSVQVLLDPARPILCDSKTTRWIHHSFYYSHRGELLHGGDGFLVVRRVDPPFSNCFLLSPFSFLLSCRTYHNHTINRVNGADFCPTLKLYHRLMRRHQLTLSTFVFWFGFFPLSGKETHKKKRILLWYIGIVAHSL